MNRKDEIEDLARQLIRIHIDRETLIEKEKKILRRIEEIQSSSATTSGTTKPEKHSERQVKGGPIEQQRTARDGNLLQVGDRVEFLTEGQYKNKHWTVYKLTEKRVLCEGNKKGQKTHREYRNVRKVFG